MNASQQNWQDTESTPKGWTYDGELVPVVVALQIEIEAEVVRSVGHSAIFRTQETIFYLMRNEPQRFHGAVYLVCRREFPE